MPTVVPALISLFIYLYEANLPEITNPFYVVFPMN